MKGEDVALVVGLGVLVIALGFVALILVINSHLSHLRRDFSDLRAYLVTILGDR